jgi:hypothetical protein
MDPETELLLEQSFARVRHYDPISFFIHTSQVPHENYRKVFRAGQKHIEKDFGPITTLTSNIAQSSKEEDAKDTAETAATLDQLIAKVEGLKRKVRLFVAWKIHLIHRE